MQQFCKQRRAVHPGSQPGTFQYEQETLQSSQRLTDWKTECLLQIQQKSSENQRIIFSESVSLLLWISHRTQWILFLDYMIYKDATHKKRVIERYVLLPVAKGLDGLTKT